MACMARRVLIVDDHASFRAARACLLEADGFEVVGEAADGARPSRSARGSGPTLVLLDVQLPDLDGFAVAERARRAGARRRRWCSCRAALAPAIAGGWSSARVVGFLTKSELSSESLGALLA